MALCRFQSVFRSRLEPSSTSFAEAPRPGGARSDAVELQEPFILNRIPCRRDRRQFPHQALALFAIVGFRLGWVGSRACLTIELGIVLEPFWRLEVMIAGLR